MTISTPKEQILKIGSKGEIFPPKEISEYLGLTPNQTIIVNVYQDKLIIRKLNSIKEILSTHPKVTISYSAWKQFKANLQENIEK